MKSKLVKSKLAIFCLLVLTASLSQAQIFGGKREREEKLPTLPAMPATGNVAPGFITKSDKPESTAPASSNGSVATNEKEITPTFLRRTMRERNDIAGWSSLSGIGVNFGTGFGLGAQARAGYTFPFGLYVGGTGLLSGGTTFETQNPMLSQVTVGGNTVFNNTVGGEVGLEVPLKLFGVRFLNRGYLGAGIMWTNLVFNSVGNLNGLPNATGNFTGVPTTNVPSAGTNVYYSIGNVFYAPMDVWILRNVAVGIDMRYISMGSISAIGVAPVIGLLF